MNNPNDPSNTSKPQNISLYKQDEYLKFTPKVERLTEAEISKLVEARNLVGKIISPQRALYMQLDIENKVKGDKITIGKEYNQFFGYIRMSISRYSKNTGAMFISKINVERGLDIICQHSPELDRIAKENAAEVMKHSTIPAIPAILTFDPKPEPLPPVPVYVAPVMHPTREELHAWLTKQETGFSYVYQCGKDGSTSNQLICDWTNELDNFSAGIEREADVERVEMEKVT